MPTWERDVWEPRARAHAARVDAWTRPHLERRGRGERHPVEDFLFSYYSQSPAQLGRWHPGYGVVLLDAPEYAGLAGYVAAPDPVVHDVLTSSRGVSRSERRGVSVAGSVLDARRPLLDGIHRLLSATEGRPPTLGCFGLHEWAMVYRADETRHRVPLRLGAAGTDAVVESHRVGCSHFDAFRFFTDEARPLNALQPGRDDRASYEQPGCLHAGMDLYKHAFRLSPLVPSELVADCFALARDIRTLDMRASPYDLGAWGYSPVAIETAAGKREYVAAQRDFAERGRPLRRRLVEECERLLGC